MINAPKERLYFFAGFGRGYVETTFKPKEVTLLKTCLFCNIASGKIDAEIVFRNDKFFVLKDINPQAPVHLLIIPVKHYSNLSEACQEDPQLVSLLLAEASRLGEEKGKEKGYRIVINTGEYGGQTVNHLHVHILAGRTLQWPPG